MPYYQDISQYDKQYDAQRQADRNQSDKLSQTLSDAIAQAQQQRGQQAITAAEQAQKENLQKQTHWMDTAAQGASLGSAAGPWDTCRSTGVCAPAQARWLRSGRRPY